MTDEVGELVLRDNYDQATALGNARAQSRSLLPVHKRLIAELERARPARPGAGGPADRRGARRPRGRRRGPHLARVRGPAVLREDRPRARDPRLRPAGRGMDQRGARRLLPDRPARAVRRGDGRAPAAPRDRHHGRRQRGRQPGRHSFFYRASEETGAGSADVLRASVVDPRGLRAQRAAHAPSRSWTTRSRPKSQTEVYLEIRRLLDRAVRWLVSNRRLPIDVPGEIARLRPGISRLLRELDTLFRGREREALHANAVQLRELGLPDELAELATRIMYGFGLLDIVEVASQTGRDVNEVADGLLRALRALPHRRPAVEDLRPAPRGPLADPGPHGAALRPVCGAGGPDRRGAQRHAPSGTPRPASTSGSRATPRRSPAPATPSASSASPPATWPRSPSCSARSARWFGPPPPDPFHDPEDLVYPQVHRIFRIMGSRRSCPQAGSRSLRRCGQWPGWSGAR